MYDLLGSTVCLIKYRSVCSCIQTKEPFAVYEAQVGWISPDRSIPSASQRGAGGGSPRVSGLRFKKWSRAYMPAPPTTSHCVASNAHAGVVWRVRVRCGAPRRARRGSVARREGAGRGWCTARTCAVPVGDPRHGTARHT